MLENKSCERIPNCPQSVPAKPPEEIKLKWKPVQPALQIQIPGFPKFSELPPKAIEEEGGQYVYIPFIGEYLAAIYRYAVAIVGIVAAVFIIYGGFQYITSAGNVTKIGQAKETIINAITALILVLGSYVVFYTIDPQLVQFKHLKILVVQNVPFEEDESVMTGSCGDFAKGSKNAQCLAEKFGKNQTEIESKLVDVTYTNKKSGSTKQFKVHQAVKADLEAVFKEIENHDYNIARDPSGGTYAFRCNKNVPTAPSLHAFGMSIDINPDKNPNCPRNTACFTSPQTDIPEEIKNSFKRHNFFWGGDFKSVKDYMHFSWTGHGCGGIK